MKGFKPKLLCKKQIETSNKSSVLLELGEVKKTCNCKSGKCKKES